MIGIEIEVSAVVETIEIRVGTSNTHTIITRVLRCMNGDVGIEGSCSRSAFSSIDNLIIIKCQIVIKIHPNDKGVRKIASRGRYCYSGFNTSLNSTYHIRIVAIIGT